MIARFAPIIALLLSVGLVQAANGLLVVLLGLRMVGEPFLATITGLVMSAYFLGLMIGSLICRQLIKPLAEFGVSRRLRRSCQPVPSPTQSGLIPCIGRPYDSSRGFAWAAFSWSRKTG